MNTVKIILTGTGALSRAIVETFSMSGLTDIHVYIYSRSYSGSAWLATIGNIRSSFAKNRLKFIPKEMDWGSESFMLDQIATIAPDIFVHTASLQSMWSLKQDTRWAHLIRSSGYGVSLPLQCKLALKVGKSCAQLPDPPRFINCCYPDAVNAVLKLCGYDIYSGIGNIGIIDMFLSHGIHMIQNYKMLANHYHVQELIRPSVEREELPRLWAGDSMEEIRDTRKFFDGLRLVNEPSLNAVTALTCLNLIHAMINKGEYMLHLPGPNGWVGGYPVVIRNGAIQFIGTGRLPEAEERRWNREIMVKEGIEIENTGFCFSENVRKKLGEYSRELAAGCPYSQIEAYLDAFLQMKEYLSVQN